MRFTWKIKPLTHRQKAFGPAKVYAMIEFYEDGRLVSLTYLNTPWKDFLPVLEDTLSIETE